MRRSTRSRDGSSGPRVSGRRGGTARRSPALGLSPRWQSRPSHRRSRASDAAATSRPGSGSCRDSTATGGKPGRQDIEDGPTRSAAAVDHGRHGCRQLGGSRGATNDPWLADAGPQAENAGRGWPDRMARIIWALLPGSRRRLRPAKGGEPSGVWAGCKGKRSSGSGKPTTGGAFASPVRASPYVMAASNQPIMRPATDDCTWHVPNRGLQ